MVDVTTARDYVRMRQEQLRADVRRNVNAAFARAAVAFCAWLAGDAIPAIGVVVWFVAVGFGAAAVIAFWAAGCADMASKVELDET
jgi:hypothetical protein